MLPEEILSRLDILPLEGLRIHEQTIPENVRALRETMLNLGRIVDPLIVDRKNRVVLDGNHRREVLAAMDCENAVCQVVDYDDPSIRIGVWYPASLSLTTALGGEKVDKAAGKAALDRMEACFMLVKKENGQEECRLFPSSDRQLRAVLDDQEKLLRKWAPTAGPANGNGNGMQYIEDNRDQFFLDLGYGVLERRPFSKQEVVAEALAGRPLPPKSTRHHIPNRIIRLNFHLGYLNETPETAKLLLAEMVKKRVKYGSARYYTEPVIVLY
ncbi:MAG: hypothetical protein KGH63_03890 [Candidatus Micrarchaeota archaeon]|nr:hypothetical protein [Candidatus Micrarchaeota archaeon]